MIVPDMLLLQDRSSLSRAPEMGMPRVEQ